jgi:hypothetical protein
VQLKTTAQKREDGKGNADNVGNKGGMKKSSLAAASALSPAVSALGQTSLSKLPSKGKGGMKAGSRNSGPTDNRSRGGGKAAGSATKPESTQKKEAAKGRNMGDDLESMKAKQADPQDTSGRIGKDVLSQLKDQAAKKLERLAKERAEGDATTKSRVNNVANKNTNPKTVSSSREDRQANPAATYNMKAVHQESTSPFTSGHDNNQERGTAKGVGDFSGGGYNKRRSRLYSPLVITGTRQQHTQEIRTSHTSSALPTEGVASKWQGIGSPARGMKSCKPPPPQKSESMSTHSSSSLSTKDLELTLGEDTEETSGTSLMKCDSVEGALGQIKIYMTGTFNIKEIKLGGGKVTSNIKEANLVVVGTNPREREMEYLKGRLIPQINLELLFKVLQAEVPLLSIMDTPGKVSFASSTIGIQRGDSSSSKSVSKYGFPPRIPAGPSYSPSILSPSWNSKSASSQGGIGLSKFGRTVGGGTLPVDLTPKHTNFLNILPTDRKPCGYCAIVDLRLIEGFQRGG